jgi:hypothetical protein
MKDTDVTEIMDRLNKAGVTFKEESKKPPTS